MVQAQAYSENLVLTRRYTACLGQSRFFLHDEVENVGQLPTVHMSLYHIKIGFPFVSENAELVAPIMPPARLLFGDIDPDRPEEYTRFVHPKKDCLFEGLEFTMAGEPDGRVPVAIFNPQCDILRLRPD